MPVLSYGYLLFLRKQNYVLHLHRAPLRDNRTITLHCALATCKIGLETVRFSGRLEPF